MLGGAPGAVIVGAGAGLYGGMKGEKAAEPYAEQALPRYQAMKRSVKMTTAEAQQFLRKLQVLGTDKYYIDRAAARRRMTDRGY